MITRTVLVLIGSLTFLTACGGDSSSAEDKRLDVVTAFYPVAWAAEQVGGDTVSVRNLTQPGVEPHDAELSPRDVERIRSAEVVLYFGSGFQPAVEDAVEGADGETVDLLEGQDLARAVDEEGELAADPHVWLDPIRYAEVVGSIAEALGRSAERDGLLSRLAALDRDFEQGLANCRRREIVTTHAAFGYLARRYRLEQIALTGLSPEAEPTPQDLENVVQQVQDSKATTIFFETLISPRLAETVARETGATTAVLDPIEGLAEDAIGRGEDYLSVMRANLAALRRALDCR